MAEPKEQKEQRRRENAAIMTLATWEIGMDSAAIFRMWLDWFQKREAKHG